jgi:hypothetical protein
VASPGALHQPVGSTITTSTTKSKSPVQSEPRSLSASPGHDASFENSSQSSAASQPSQPQSQPQQYSRPQPLQLSVPDHGLVAPFPGLPANELTPPSSAASSIGNQGAGYPSSSATPKKATQGNGDDTALVSGLASPSRRARTDSTAGSKRTASGQVKNASHEEIPQSNISGVPGRSYHRRGLSSLSAASSSNVTEVSPVKQHSPYS